MAFEALQTARRTRLKATLVMTMFCGFPLGSTIGGIIRLLLPALYFQTRSEITSPVALP